MNQSECPEVCAQSEKCHACGIDRDLGWRSEVDRRLDLLITRMASNEDTLRTVVDGIANLRLEMQVHGEHQVVADGGGHTDKATVDMKAVHVDMDRMFNLLLTRVAGNEDTLRNVVDGIANLRGELQVHVDRDVSKDAGGHTNKATGDMEAGHVDVSIDSLSGWQQCARQDNEGDTVEQVITPSCPQSQLSPQPDGPPDKEHGRPTVVVCDNVSNTSDDAKTSSDDPVSSDPSPINKTPESVGRRVHRQPRARLVSCQRQLLGVAAGAGNGEASASAPPLSNVITYKYKDPPGYEGVTDFGTTEDVCFKPPPMRPKKKHVSSDLSLKFEV